MIDLKKDTRQRDSQQGFVILEALVAMLIFAFGILGVVGTQAVMTKEQTNAKFRADAAYLAEDLVGVMWGDVANISSYSSDKCNSYGRCRDWLNKMAATIPSASATINVSSATGLVSIIISWSLPNGTVHQYTTETTIRAVGAI